MVINSLPQREENLKKRRKQRRIKYGIFVLVFFILVGVVSYLSHLPKVRINDVELRGGLLVTQKEIKEESLRYMSGSYFWLFPKNNSIIYPQNGLKKDLSEKFKRIETINVSLEGLNKIVVEITERKPVAIWCRENLAPVSTSTENSKLLDKEKCYFIDLFSTIFAEAPNFSGDAYFKYYGLVEKENPIGEKFIASSTEFTQINNFIESVKKLNIKPLYLLGKGENEYSLVLYGGGEIYFDVKKSISLAFNNLETLLKSPELSIGKTGFLPVEYIDLRYGNKLFYKLKSL
jgi:hypothetical protein